jgi:hypothetical protein
VTKLTNFTYQGRRVIGPFPPDHKPTRVGWYPAASRKEDALSMLMENIRGEYAVCDAAYFWTGHYWMFDADSGAAAQDMFWYALEEPEV